MVNTREAYRPVGDSYSMLVEHRVVRHMDFLKGEDQRRDPRSKRLADHELAQDVLDTVTALRDKAGRADALAMESQQAQVENAYLRQALQSIAKLPDPQEGDDVGVIVGRFRVAKQLARDAMPSPLRGKVIQDVLNENGGITLVFQDGTSARMAVKDRAIATEITGQS